MQAQIPSKTALRVALRRAAHQIEDRPLVFEDPIAVPMLGGSFADLLQRTPERASSVSLRAFLVARSRYAEEGLKRAVESGVRQYVLLGAGLDTFAYRNAYVGLQVFEVDHPATQEWKRELLKESGISIPESVRYVPVDFENESLETKLGAAGFQAELPAFFAWLGVVLYLTREAFGNTLQYIAKRPAGSGLTLDYAQPRSVLSPTEQLERDSLASRVLQAGEPFELFFTPEQMAAELSSFRSIEDLGSAEINARYFQGRSDQLAVRGTGGRFLTAWL